MRKIAITLAASLVFFGCAKKSLIKQGSAVSPSAEELPKQEENAELSLRGKDFSAVKEMAVIYFDLDRAELQSEMRDAAFKNAEFLKTHPNVEVKIEGYCDERGTTEYNLALGQRRAAALRAYYQSLGIKPGRMGTQSWGEEKLVCREPTEECYARNRRAETLGRVKEVLPAKTPAKGKKKPAKP